MPKEAGGLGVGDMIIKNAALLFKWWYYFSSKEKALWKRITSSCNELVLEASIWKQTKCWLGGPWSAIYSIWRINKEVEDVVMNGL